LGGSFGKAAVLDKIFHAKTQRRKKKKKGRKGFFTFGEKLIMQGANVT